MHSLDTLRRAAKTLRKACNDGDPAALERLAVHPPRSDPGKLTHADFLHVIAKENNFASWPSLKLAVEINGMDRARKQQRLKIALYHGHNSVVDRLLADTPDLAHGLLGLEIALYDLPAVKAALRRDPGSAVALLGPRRPILHLAFSKHFQAHPEKEDAMMAIADLLAGHGADVNDGFPFEPGSDHLLSALYGALGHADNMRLAAWLLEHGANPNDNESLYHATELGHRDGLRLLLRHGADPAGTNALLRALDFNDHEAVDLLVKAGADPNEGVSPHPSGEAPMVISALHQAARRMCDAKMANLLLEAGADPDLLYDGMTAHALALVFQNADVAQAIKDAGGSTELPESLQPLIAISEGRAAGVSVDPASLPKECRHMLHNLIHLPGTLPRIKRLVAGGLAFDEADDMDMTPVQLAGWAGLPEVMSFFLDMKPDLNHVNGYGGTLLSTVIHGSENAPQAVNRDHVACARLALQNGVPLPRRAIELAGEDSMAEFLADWADTHPDQSVDHGVA
ncbi:ankyrin repeat domain-containing protein [Anderseniella sp. Alg231-50]|uniref:ankyrin repeat domain-containing protein n=1 Tax=Anderseniella sp. Alg231-50 TaxID=1922226 RepID=UPI000D554AFE